MMAAGLESGEIDIMEHVGFMPDSVFSSVHTQAFNHVIRTQKQRGCFGDDLYTNFHVYAIEWSGDGIDFLSTIKFFRFVNTGKGFTEWPFDKRFSLLVNIASAETGWAKGYR